MLLKINALRSRSRRSCDSLLFLRQSLRITRCLEPVPSLPHPPPAIFLHFLMSNVKYWIKSWKSGARNRRCSRRSVVFTSLSWTCRNAALKKRISCSNNSLRSFIGWRPLEGRDHGCAHARRLSLQNKCVGSTLNSKSPLLVHSLKLLRFIPTSVALAGLVILR